MCGAPVLWRSKKQSIVALSSMEAECIAANETKDIVWIRQMLAGLGFKKGIDGSTMLYTDSQSAMDLTEKKQTAGRSRHIDARYHRIRQQIQQGTVKLQHMGTDELPAHGLTMGLEKIMFNKIHQAAQDDYHLGGAR
jgi:hypothetical protein